MDLGDDLVNGFMSNFTSILILPPDYHKGRISVFQFQLLNQVKFLTRKIGEYLEVII